MQGPRPQTDPHEPLEDAMLKQSAAAASPIGSFAVQFPRLTPLVRKLLIVLGGTYVATLILQNWVGLPIFEFLALNHRTLRLATLWQMLTYPLAMPSGPQHVFGILINLVFFWLIMAPFEERYGERRTAQLTMVATVGASFPALLVGQTVAAAGAASLYPPMYGTNPILLAAIAAFAYALRGRGTLSLFGVVPMQPVHVIYLVLGLSVLFFLASGNAVELVADFGAVGAGLLFMRWLSRPPRRRRTSSRRQAAGGTPFRVYDGGGASKPPRWLN